MSPSECEQCLNGNSAFVQFRGRLNSQNQTTGNLWGRGLWVILFKASGSRFKNIRSFISPLETVADFFCTPMTLNVSAHQNSASVWILFAMMRCAPPALLSLHFFIWFHFSPHTKFLHYDSCTNHMLALPKPRQTNCLSVCRGAESFRMAL